MRIPLRVVDPVPPLPTPSVPVKRFVPMLVVATSLPVESVERSAFVRPVKYCEPVVVAFTTSVDEAMSCAPLSQKLVVVA